MRLWFIKKVNFLLMGNLFLDRKFNMRDIVSSEKISLV